MMRYMIKRDLVFYRLLNLRASRSRVSRVEIHHQWLLSSRTLESLAILINKSKVWGSLTNLEVKSSLLP